MEMCLSLDDQVDLPAMRARRGISPWRVSCPSGCGVTAAVRQRAGESAGTRSGRVRARASPGRWIRSWTKTAFAMDDGLRLETRGPDRMRTAHCAAGLILLAPQRHLELQRPRGLHRGESVAERVVSIEPPGAGGGNPLSQGVVGTWGRAMWSRYLLRLRFSCRT